MIKKSIVQLAADAPLPPCHCQPHGAYRINGYPEYGKRGEHVLYQCPSCGAYRTRDRNQLMRALRDRYPV